MIKAYVGSKTCQFMLNNTDELAEKHRSLCRRADLGAKEPALSGTVMLQGSGLQDREVQQERSHWLLLSGRPVAK